MSNTVDKRVVQMQFDNQEFERRVKTTRASLKGLKEDLNFDDNVKQLSNLEKASKDFDLSSMSAGIEALQNRFSTMGIVGMRVLENLTDSVLRFGKKIASSTIGQIMTGGRNRALNLEQAQFQISGLGVDWKEVQKEYGRSLYEQIDKAVSGTAYGLDAAAKVAGQLLASNLKAGSKEMQDALSGISGVAAMTNSTYEDIGHIFTTIAGNGKIMGEQFNQFAGRGLNVAAALADYLGKTEEEVRDIKNNPIDFTTFAEAMNVKFGEQATKANETYTGALSNVKAALSRIGAEIQTPYLENMRKTFVALIPVLNGVKKALGPLYEVAANGMEFLSGEAVKFLEKFAFLDKEKGLQLTGLQSFVDRVQSLVEKLRSKDLAGNSVFDYIKQSFNSTKSIFNAIRGIISDVLNPFVSVFKETFPSHNIFGTIASGLQKVSSYLEELRERLRNTTDSGDKLRRIFKGILVVAKTLAILFGEAVKLGSKVVKVFANLLGVVLKLVAPIGDLAANLYYFFTESEEVKRALSPMIEAFLTLKDVVTATISIFKEAFSKAFAPFGKNVEETGTRTEKLLILLTKGITKFAEVAAKVFNRISKWLTDHRETIQKFGSGLGTALGKTLEFFRKVWSAAKIIFAGLKEGFTGFRNSIAKVAESFGSIKTDGIKKFSEKFKASTGPIQAVGRFLSSIWELAKSIMSKIGPLVKSIVTLIFDEFSSIAAIIKDGLDKLNFEGNGAGFLASGGIIAGLVVFLKKLSNINPTALGKSVTALFDTISIKLRELKKQKIAYTLKQFAGAILELAFAMVILSSIDPKRLTASLLAISVLMQELSRIMVTLNKNTKTFSFTKRSGTDSIGAMMLELAGAVLLLSIAIKEISSLDPDKMIAGLTAISALLWELVAVIKVLSNENKQMVKGSAALIFMAIAIRILTKAVISLGDLTWEQLGKGLLATIALMLSLASAVKMISKSKGIVKAALGMMLIGAALKIMVPVVKSFGDLDWSTLAKAGVGIGSLLTMITLFSKISDKKGMISSGLGMIAMAASIKIFVSVINQFETIQWSTIGKSAAVIGGLALVLALFSRVVKGGKLLVSSTAMIGIAISLRIFAVSIKQFGDLKWSKIAKAGAVIGGLLLALSLFSRFAKGLNLIVLSAGMVIFGASLMQFALVIKLFSTLSWESVAKGLGTIVAILLIFGIAAKALKGSIKTILGLAGAMVLFGLGTALFGAGLVLVSAGIAAFSGSLSIVAKSIQFILRSILETIPLVLDIIRRTLLGLINIIKDAAPAIIETLVAVIGTFLDSIIELAPKLAETVKVLLDTFLPIVVEYVPRIADAIVSIIIKVIDVLAERVPEIVYSVAKFIKRLVGAIAEVARKEFNVNSLKDVVLGFAAISAIFVAIALAGKVAQKAWKGLLVISGVMALISLMFLVLSTIDTVTFKNMADGISEAMLSISASMFIISKVPVSGAAEGIAGFAVVVAGLIAILEILGGINQIPGFLWLLEEGSKVLSAIGKAIGEFVGNIVGGLLSGIASNLPSIGESLSQFMLSLQPFIDGAKQLSPDMFKGVLELVGVIVALTAASFLKQISDFIGFFIGKKSFADLGNELCEFGETMITFAETVKPLNDKALDHIRKAAEAAQALADFASAVPNSGGLVDLFTGDNDIDKWGEKLPGFGTALADFANSISGLDEASMEKIKIATEAGRLIAEMAEGIPNEGGVKAFFEGDNSLAKFAPQLKPFGENLKSFAETVSDMNETRLDAIKIACQAGAAIAEMAEGIPNEGGVKAFFEGDNSLAKFAPQLKPFGENLKSFGNEVLYLPVEAILKAVGATAEIVKMSNDIPNTGGLASWFSGDNSLSGFGEELEDFGPYLKGFADEVSGISNFDSLDKAVRCVSTLITAAANVEEFDAGDSLEGLADGLAYLVENSFIENVASLSSSLKNVRSVYIANAINGITDSIKNISEISVKDKLTELADSMAYLITKNFGENVASLSSSLKNARCIYITNAITKLVDSIGNVDDLDIDDGLEELADGIEYLWVNDFGENVAKISGALKGVKGALLATVIKNIVEASSSLNDLDIDDGLEELVDGIKYLWLNDFGENVVKISGALKGVKGALLATVIKNIVEASSSLNDLDIDDGFSKLADAVKSLSEKDFGENLKAVMDSLLGLSYSDKDFKMVMSRFEDISLLSSPMSKLKEVDVDGTSSFVSAFNSLARLNISSYVSTFSSNESIKSAVSAGTNFLKSIIDGMSNYKSTATSNLSGLVRDLMYKITSKLKSYNSNFVDIGKDFVRGLGEGISGNANLAVTPARLVAENIVTGTKITLQEKSPSRVGREIGMFWDLGLANGIITYSSAVSKANEKVSSSIIDNTYNTMTGLSSLDLDNLDVSPTIRPVIDMSEVHRGIGQIVGLIDNTRAFTISSSISKERAKLLNDGETIKVETTNSDVVAAVNELRSDLAAMKDELSKFGIYLDGDTLVGELAPGMDAALGRRKKYYDRRG